MKKSVKKDQDTWYDKQAEIMEEAQKHNDTRAVYQCVDRLSGKATKIASNVKDEAGKLLTNHKDRSNRWSGYFENFLTTLFSWIATCVYGGDNEENGVKLEEESYVTDREFADDNFTVSETEQGLQILLNDLDFSGV